MLHQQLFVQDTYYPFANGGSLGSGATWRWYSDPTYTTQVGTSSAPDASLTLTPTSTTTYYLRAEGTIAPCSSTVSGLPQGSQ